MVELERAAEAIATAGALVVAAGAGMGVDSGLPDFRGDQGFWRAYPPYRKLGLSFVQMANPRGFSTDPALAWGFYGHRRRLYRATRPHPGFAILRVLAERKPLGGFVYTSNVDGQFQEAGFPPERVLECHGSILWDQCLHGCGHPIWPAGEHEVEVDESTMRAVGDLPGCPGCGGLARPNILMFGDGGWDPARYYEQGARLQRWLEQARAAAVTVVECGAGTAVPSVRMFSEQLVRTHGATLVRINPREPQVPRGQLGLAMGALEALMEVERQLQRT